MWNTKWSMAVVVVCSLVFPWPLESVIAQEPVTQESITQESKVDQPKTEFVRHQFTVSRNRGKISINSSLAPAHPLQTHSLELSLIQWFDNLKFQHDRDFFAWAGKLNGTRTYTYDEVIQTDAEGNRTSKPLVLHNAKEREALDPLWRNWLDDQKAAQELAEQRRKTAELESKVYEQRQQTLNAQLQSLQAQADAANRSATSLSVISGETSLWEVELVPQGRMSSGYFSTTSGSGAFTGYETSGVSLSTYGMGIETSFGSGNSFVYGGKYVQAYGRTSQDAANNAVYDNPGYRAGSIRRLSR